MSHQFFRISERERDAIRSCLAQLDQARIDLETNDERNARDNRIVSQIENCHDGIHGVLNALTPEQSD